MAETDIIGENTGVLFAPQNGSIFPEFKGISISEALDLGAIFVNRGGGGDIGFNMASGKFGGKAGKFGNGLDGGSTDGEAGFGGFYR